MSDYTPNSAAERYHLVPVDALAEATPKLEASDADVRRALGQAEVKRVQQDNDHRRLFLIWVLSVVSVALLASACVMGFYVWSEWHEVRPEVMVAWLSASVVQTIGLAYVIARYLFPDHHRESSTANP